MGMKIVFNGHNIIIQNIFPVERSLQFSALNSDVSFEILKELKTYVITIDISGWTAETGGYYANATLTGLLATDKPYWSMRSATNYPTTAEEANYKLLKSVTCAADTLTFHATAAPSAALTIEVRL